MQIFNAISAKNLLIQDVTKNMQMWEKKLFLKINLLYRIINQGNLLNKTRKNVCKLVLKITLW